MPITNVNMLRCSNEGFGVMQGHSGSKRNGKVDEKRSWSSQNQLSDSLSRPTAQLMFKQNSPDIIPIWPANRQFSVITNGLIVVI